MKAKNVCPIVFLLCLFGVLQAQNAAALEKLQHRLNAEQIAEMQSRTHYKYEGMVLFYSSSFLVVDNGQSRAATDAEIQAIDIDQYNSLRNDKENVTVYDEVLRKDVILLSRKAFEAVVLAHLNEFDKKAYLAYVRTASEMALKTNQ